MKIGNRVRDKDSQETATVTEIHENGMITIRWDAPYSVEGFWPANEFELVQDEVAVRRDELATLQAALEAQSERIKAQDAEIENLRQFIYAFSKNADNSVGASLKVMAQSMIEQWEDSEAPATVTTVSPKFKVGQRVRVIRDTWEKGRTGKIAKKGEKGFHVYTDGYGDHDGWYSADELEAVE